ncbi:hypothetical protein BTH42_20225 [Burkholderia sp. SRS-W-2-2016]|nr:hypothetical protein BTH42_20225 [Burkholderia sp. SRS-W-2-2016]
MTTATGLRIQPRGEVIYRSQVGSNYLTVCFSDRWDEALFEDFPGTDACLVIHDVKEFSERFHAAASARLPTWIGIDGPVSYGGRSELGAVFSKPLRFITQHEWRFAWRPLVPNELVEAVVVQLGSIANIAEIVERPHHAPSA